MLIMSVTYTYMGLLYCSSFYLCVNKHVSMMSFNLLCHLTHGSSDYIMFEMIQGCIQDFSKVVSSVIGAGVGGADQYMTDFKIEIL